MELTSFPSTTYWRGCLFSTVYLPPLSKIRWPYVCGFISGLSILFHWSIFLFLCQYHTVLKTVALWYSLKSGRLIPPAPYFFLKIALAMWGLSCSHTNCEFFCSSSVIKAIGSFPCGILPDQGSNPCPLHWQADSQPLRHQGSPNFLFLRHLCLVLVSGWWWPRRMSLGVFLPQL